MNRDEEHRGQRKDHAVKHIKSQQRIGINSVATEKQEMDLVADEWYGGSDVRSNRDGPVSQLIPRQQVSGIAEQQGYKKKDDADDPIELARRTIRPAIENFEHVREHQKDHRMRRPAVQVAQEQSGRYDE